MYAVDTSLFYCVAAITKCSMHAIISEELNAGIRLLLPFVWC